MYFWIITASLWNVTGALRVVPLNPTWKGLSIEKYLSKNLGITWIKPYIHPDCRLLSQHNEIAVFLSIIIFAKKKKKSPAALLSPCKFLPGVNVAQSSCLCVLNSFSIKSSQISICPPAAQRTIQGCEWGWLSAKCK